VKAPDNYERALLEQIDYLRAELERYRLAQQGPPPEDAPPIEWALRDPRFLQWRQLRRSIEEDARR